jgi:AhpD family alkylhydroperoxidase
MAMIEPLSQDPGDPRYQRLLADARERGTPDERMVRVYGRSEIGVKWLALCNDLFYSGLLPHRLKELIRIRMSVAEECGYCSSLRSTQAEREGLTEDVVMQMLDLEHAPDLTAQEKAAIRYADRYRREDVQGQQVFDALREHFDDEQIIELGVLCSALHGGGPFAKSLEVLTWAQACELRPELGALSAGVPAGGAAPASA